MPSVTLPDGVAEITVAAAWNPVDRHGDRSRRPRQRRRFSAGRIRGWWAASSGPRCRILSRGSERGQAETSRRRGTSAFAVNLAPEESQLAAAGEEDIRRWLPGVSLRVVDASAEAQQQFGSVGEGTEILAMAVGLYLHRHRRRVHALHAFGPPGRAARTIVGTLAPIVASFVPGRAGPAEAEAMSTCRPPTWSRSSG